MNSVILVVLVKFVMFEICCVFFQSKEILTFVPNFIFLLLFFFFLKKKSSLPPDYMC